LTKKSVKVARERLKSDTVYAMSLDEFVEFAKDKNLKFDVVTFLPKQFLENVGKLLKPNGFIAGSVPNRDFILKEINWKYFSVDYPPHHFLRFSSKASPTF